MPAQFDQRSAERSLNLSRCPPPASVDELLARAQAAAGQDLGWLARQLHTAPPPELQHDKGWAGMLLENWLGASAGSRPQPDFPQLGIELKTLPVDPTGKPLESTYVCTVSLLPTSATWETSLVRRKLAQVLWIPLVTMRGKEPGTRRIGTALLWQPDAGQEAILRADWEELMELVATGSLDQISAARGQYLQIRPKAANARALTAGIDVDGDIAPTLPRGFYLRARFTATLLKQHFSLSE